MQRDEALILESASPDPARPVSPRVLGLVMSAGLLGMALHLTDGLYSPVGLGVLTLSLILCAASVLWPVRENVLTGGDSEARVSPKTFQLFLAGLVAVQLFSMLFAPAGATEATVPKVSQRPFHIGVATAAVGLAILAFGQKRLLMRAGFALMLLSFLGIGIWKIYSAPAPFIDVFIFHRDAANALAHGINPYTITFPNIYGKDAYVYGPGVIEGDRLLFGYPYPPLILLCTSAAHLAFGDARYAMLIAMALSAWMIASIKSDRVGMLIGMLFLFTPRVFYILELAWTEPLSVMLLTGFALLAYRYYHSHEDPLQANRRYFMPAAIMLGLLMASKQYLPATILLTPILLRSKTYLRSFILAIVVAITAALLVSLPLMLWDLKAFWHSAITLQMRQPYRPDSLSYLAWWGFGQKGWTGPFWLAFAMLFGVAAITVWRCPRGITGFMLAFALTYFCFIAFNKQAFANYYYLVFGAICCAAGLLPASITFPGTDFGRPAK